MNPHLFALILASVGLSAVAQMFLKMGVTAVRAAEAGGLTSTLFAYATSPFVVLGLGLYGFGAILWLFVLARLPLTAAYPFVGLGFIATMAIGILALNEAVTPGRIAGTVLIAAGCVLVARSIG
jgi:multidrug transporter EmrE-like cation transporter